MNTQAIRTITDHKLNGLNDALNITVMDPPGSGGASHLYLMSVDETKTQLAEGVTVHQSIQFQNGPIGEVGVNGVSQEALLAIVIDRLRSFQEGQFKCRENTIALTHCEDALMWLQKRTRDRIARGVEGTTNK